MEQIQVQEKFAKSIWSIGKKFLLIGSHEAFSNDSSKMEIVLVEICEERLDVKGDYRPEVLHAGYRAKDKDGNLYQCQWHCFDDASHQPYQNWFRVTRPVQLMWELTHFMPYLQPDTMRALTVRVNQMFPENSISRCEKLFEKNPANDKDRRHHVWHYVANGSCFFCQHGL